MIMKYRIYNDNGTDTCDFEGKTIEEIQEKAKERINLPGWKNGWSQKIAEE